jgi:secreted PhoX family phosphatase
MGELEMTENRPQSRALAFEAAEDVGSNLSDNPTMGDIIAARFSRRGFLKGSLAVTAITATVSPLALMAADKARAASPTFTFEEIEAGVDRKHHVAPGYDADILIRWGDPVEADAPAFDPMNQTAAAQAKQFGYNNDFLGIVEIPGVDPAERALLVVNHEYTTEEIMFPGVKSSHEDKEPDFSDMPKEFVDVEIAAHGGSVVEIEKVDGKWRPAAGSKYNRRITGETEIALSGPAAGSDRVKTSADPTGTRVRGMLNNCAGGITPWGTWLSSEENFNGYFWGALPEGSREAANYKRLGVPSKWYNWGVYHDRFDVSKEPNEPNRFGWIVEIDPLDPASMPKKRTALGRYKHEGAATIVNGDGRVVVYSGDDERFDYVYKFVTDGQFNPNDRAANMDLLDKGTLYVARFNADGTGIWMPLVHGEGPLTAANGFESQADVLIGTRLAADLLGATKMDRPEDVEANAKTGKVYVMLTNNTRRTAEQVDAANPREKNAFGHIVEIEPEGGDQASTAFKWEVLLKAGDPSVAAVGATFNPATTTSGWFGMPDNCAVDNQGRLWVTTDGNNFKATGRTDGVWAVETEGEGRATSKLFFRVPVGAEMCGPYFTKADDALFVAVQHPGEGGDEWPEFGRISTFADPVTRWPDFKDGMPPRPSVVVITKQGGGVIGA